MAYGHLLINFWQLDVKADRRGIAESIGFEAVDSGPLANARHLEPMAMLAIFAPPFGDWGRDGTCLLPKLC